MIRQSRITRPSATRPSPDSTAGRCIRSPPSPTNLTTTISWTNGTSETPPGAINASTTQKEGKVSVGNAGASTAYAMPLPVPDDAYATVSDTQRYSMPISQDEGAYSMPLSSQMVSSDDAFGAYV